MCPIYEYNCENSRCKHIFEHLQGITEAKLQKCPKCKKNTLVRLIGAGIGLIFKGPGFFCNDYPKKGDISNDAK